MSTEDHVKLWIDDLLSGKFSQARGRLRRNDSYCCLGVACERFRRETGQGYWANDEFVLNDGISTTGLPFEVIDWYGLNPESTEGAYYENGFGSCLSRQNDDGKSFEEIAEIIKSKPPKLFKEQPIKLGEYLQTVTETARRQQKEKDAKEKEELAPLIDDILADIVRVCADYALKNGTMGFSIGADVLFKNILYRHRPYAWDQIQEFLQGEGISTHYEKWIHGDLLTFDWTPKS